MTEQSYFRDLQRRLADVQCLAGLHSEDFHHLGVEADLAIGHLEVGVGVEDKLARRALVPVAA